MEYVIRCFLTHVLCKQERNVTKKKCKTSGELHEILSTVPEPRNIVDNYAVSEQRDGEVVGHLMKEKSSRFATTIFYFLPADKNDCTVVVTGKAINRGDVKRMQVPCTLNFKGHRKWIDILKKELIGKD